MTPTHQVEVEMMHKQKNFQYAELPDLKAEVVALPYRGGRLSMVIILPQSADGLDSIQVNIGSVLQGGRSLVRELLTTADLIELGLPKFKVSTDLDSLEEWLLEDVRNFKVIEIKIKLGLIYLFDS